MFEELDEMSKGQNYMIMNVYLVEKGLPEFLIEEFRQDAIFGSQAIASLDEMPVLELSTLWSKI